MKDKELQDAIKLIDEEKGAAPTGFTDNIDSEIGYTVGAVKVPTKIEIGHDTQRRDEDNPDCYCKIVTVQGSPMFYIKSDLSDTLANPWEAITSFSQDRRFTKRTGRPAWKFSKVNKECFVLYLKFLSTRNNSYYRMCERINKNG